MFQWFNPLWPVVHACVYFPSLDIQERLKETTIPIPPCLVLEPRTLWLGTECTERYTTAVCVLFKVLHLPGCSIQNLSHSITSFLCVDIYKRETEKTDLEKQRSRDREIGKHTGNRQTGRSRDI